MMFSSKLPFNDDPSPYVCLHPAADEPVGIRFEDDCGDDRFDPRPEFDRPQNNPTNRALTHFRQLHGKKPATELANAATHWLASLHDMRIAGAYTTAEEDHARRVLARLSVRHMK